MLSITSSHEYFHLEYTHTPASASYRYIILLVYMYAKVI